MTAASQNRNTNKVMDGKATSKAVRKRSLRTKGMMAR
jgi:hypothetical protein